jgi:glycosyltransferase involved in cell wall biosynthesis
MPEAPRLSIVIPVRDEQDTVHEIAERIARVLGDGYELIFVDDGSVDDTWERLQAMHRPGRVRVLRLRRNFGKTAALMAGFALVRGETVITMDGDLQDDPSEIPRFLAKLEEGYDLVTGWKKRRHDPISKVVSSRLFNFAVRRSTGLAVRDINCGFKAFRGEAACSLRIYGEMHRFIPVLVAAEGFRVTEIEVTHHPRRHGRSKYGIERMFKGFFDLVTVIFLTRFRERPAHGFGWAAVLWFLLSSMALAAWVVLGAGPALLLAGSATFFLAGTLFLGIGWAAEYILAFRSAESSLPFYAIRERLD